MRIGISLVEATSMHTATLVVEAFAHKLEARLVEIP